MLGAIDLDRCSYRSVPMLPLTMESNIVTSMSKDCYNVIIISVPSSHRKSAYCYSTMRYVTQYFDGFGVKKATDSKL
jgi:hypothetical protein